MKWQVMAILAVAIIAVAAGFVGGLLRQNRPPPLPPTQNIMQTIKLTSPAFENNTLMPARFTCDGEGVSPPLETAGVPSGVKSLALIMHDPDAPLTGGWTHWLKWNMPPVTISIDEGTEPAGVSGKASGGHLSYESPCPPSGTHRYVFTIFALDVEFSLHAGASRTELLEAMSGHVVGEGKLTGLYSRKK